MYILVINPGSTSTKMAVFEDEKPMILRGITHTNEELAKFGDDVLNQLDYRKQLVLDELERMNVAMQFEAVIGRGGLVKPIAGGVYEINQQMLDDTLNGIAMHNHACNLGCLIAHDIAQGAQAGKWGVVVDGALTGARVDTKTVRMPVDSARDKNLIVGDFNGDRVDKVLQRICEVCAITVHLGMRRHAHGYKYKVRDYLPHFTIFYLRCKVTKKIRVDYVFFFFCYN